MGKKALALFDFDGTLIKGDSIIRYIQFARQHKKMSFTQYINTLLFSVLYVFHFVTAERAKNVAFTFWACMPQKERVAFDQAFAEMLVEKVYAQGKQCIKQYQNEGKLVLLVSASTENYMRHVGKLLNVDDVLSTPITPSGVVFDNCKGKQKLKRIDIWLQEQDVVCIEEDTVAYGDTAGDYYMLDRFSKGYMVNPNKALLKKGKGKFEKIMWR